MSCGSGASREHDRHLLDITARSACYTVNTKISDVMTDPVFGSWGRMLFPADKFAALFGEANEGFGVLMAATIGVPLYACGGGTIPLIREWLAMGMSMGSAAAFMLTGPATKITNLGALKIVLGTKRFALYIAFVMAFSLVTGLVVNLVV